MPLKRVAYLMFSIMMLALLSINALAADIAGKKVLVISGVSEASAPNVIGYQAVYDGINEVLNAAGISPEYQWVELDSLPSDEAKTVEGDAAIAKARKLKPDLIITLNDDALKFIGARIDDIPVVFCWIFGSPKDLGMPKDNVTGVIRTSYAADIWKLANELMGVKTVGMISKYSATVAGVKKYLTVKADLLEKYSGVRFKDMVLCNSFDEWKNTVSSFSYDLLYLADTSRITKDGKEMSRQETTAWTVANTKVPVIAASEKDVEAGALFSIVTSETRIGKIAAETGLGILKSGEVSQVYQESKKGKLVFNAKTAKKYNLEIPYNVLSSAEKIYE